MTASSRVVAVALVAGLCLASEARSAEENEVAKSVLQLAVNEQTAGVTVNDREASNACAYGLVLFDHTTATGRIWYATLLEALGTGAAVDLIYERSGSRCDLVQAQIR